MQKEYTLKENIEWLLKYYKTELDILKNNENAQDCEYGYSKDQWEIDADNIITELEYALKISKED